MVQSDMRDRAGRYVAQVTGYNAFIPAPLPPNPPVHLDGDLLSLLTRAGIALGRLDGSIQTLPHPDMFVFMYVRREAVLSSQIEGTQSSLRDVLAAEAKLYSRDQPRDVNEVINYVAAMEYGLERLATLPLSVRLIREIHARLLHGVRGAQASPGELRTSQNWIGPGGCTLAEATFVPPPPSVVPDALADLERFLHQESPLPLLVRVGLAHAQFETIHPFLDGNGRVGRLLIAFLLCQEQALAKPVLYLSHYFKAHRQEYYEQLQRVRDEGDWESWLTFFLQGIHEVSEQAVSLTRAILLLREKHRTMITDSLGASAASGHRVVEHLYQKPIVSIPDVSRITGRSYQAANQLTSRLVDLGILVEMTGQRRNRRYVYQDYVQLFNDAG